MYKEQKYLDQLKCNKTFQKQPPRYVFQICVLQIGLKPLKNMFKGNDFKGFQINVLQVYFENLHHSCRNSYM